MAALRGSSIMHKLRAGEDFSRLIPCMGSARGHGGTAPCSREIPACRTDTFIISPIITLL